MEPLKTLADLREAKRIARVDYDHSLAKMVSSKKKIRKSKKMAFLSAFSTTKSSGTSQPAIKVKVKRFQTKKTVTKHECRSGPSKERQIQIFVNNPVKEAICLQIHPSTSISDLKRLLQDRLGIEPEKQRLVTLKGFELCDALSMKDHGIERDTNLELCLVPGLMGGGKKKRKSAGTREPTRIPQSPEEPKSQNAPAERQEQSTEPNTSAAISSIANQVVNLNLHLKDSSCHIGPTSGNKFYYGVPVTSDVLQDGKENEVLTKGLLVLMQNKFQEYHMIMGLFNLFKECDAAELDRVDPGSVKFTVKVKSREGLDKLWDMFTTGELTKRLTEILVTDELTTEDKSNIVIKVTMMESDYKEGCRFFKQYQERTQQKLPERMSDWTAHHVKCWLLDIGIPDSVADQLFKEDIDGKALKIYTKELLIEDFNMTKGRLRLILDRKEKRLQSETKYLKRPTKQKPVENDEEEFQQRQDHSFQMARNVPVPEKPTLSACPTTPIPQDKSTFLEHQTPQSFGQIHADSKDYTVQMAKSVADEPVTSPPSVHPKAAKSNGKCNSKNQMASDIPGHQSSEENIGPIQAEIQDHNEREEQATCITTDDVETSPPSARPQTSKSQGTSSKKKHAASLVKNETSSGSVQVSVEQHGHTVHSGEHHKPLTHKAGEIPPPSVRPKTKLSPEKSTQMRHTASTPPEHDVSKVPGQIHAESQDKHHRPQTHNTDDTTSTPEKKIAIIPPINKSLALKSDVPKALTIVQKDKQDKDMTTSSEERQPKPSVNKDQISTVVSCKVVPSHTTMAHLAVDAQSEEHRLRELLTGKKDGEIDKSFYPVLVANKPPEHLLLESESESDTIVQPFEFIKTIKWVTVLDLYSKSLENGLCKLYHDDQMVTLQNPDLFKDIESDEEFRNRIEFPEKTLWMFANGREDDVINESRPMNLQDWNRERSKDVEASVTFFSRPSVIPKGRAVIMFLLLSDGDIDILCDIFRKMSSSFEGLQNITCIAEDQKVYAKFVSSIERWVSKDEIDKRSVVGLKWDKINSIIMRMKGVNRTKANELPFSLGGRSCFLSEKLKQSWNDLTVICKNECENTDMDESNPGYKQFVGKKELSFYKGEKVDWWNFAIQDSERKTNKSCGQVLKRKGFGDVLKKMCTALNSSKIDDSLIVTVLLLHQPGAGGSTLARYVMWELHKNYCCIEVNRVTVNTVNQIIQVRRYGYEKENARKIPPVCLLIDDLDDVELFDLIAELEEVSKDIHLDGGAVCAILHCKRSAEPDKIVGHKGRGHDRDRVISLYQKLDSTEREWFKRKYNELENKDKQVKTGEYNPENLLAFMVMKEEFNPDYISKVVSRILSEIKDNELLLIKYCAFLNSYLPGSVLPIACCDSVMSLPIFKSTKRKGRSKMSSCPWENLVSSSFNIMVSTDHSGIKIFHTSIAKEALRQTQQKSADQSLLDVTTEFLNSEILRSQSHSLVDLRKTTHDLLVKRTKFGDDTKTAFSLLIEDICKFHGPEKGAEVLKLGFEKLKDAFVAQQLARLYLKENDFENAHTFADKALTLDPQNTYFWDTKGRIHKSSMDVLAESYLIDQQALESDKSSKFIEEAFETMDVFQKSYAVSRETNKIEYTGLYAEVDVAFKLLQVIHLCVEPFRTQDDINILRKYLLQLKMPQEIGYPNWSKQCHSKMAELKHRVDYVLRLMDEITTFSKDSSYAKFIKAKLADMKNRMINYSFIYEKYFGEPLQINYTDETPKSVAEYRRRKVKTLHCDNFRDIFDFAKENKLECLEESQSLLLQNAKCYNHSDLKILISIHLAFSTRGKQLMSANDVYQQLVRPFKELDNGESYFPPFFMMMFLWPVEGVASERKDRHDLTYYIEELKAREYGAQNDTRKKVPHQDRFKRHAQQLKPRTYFFLGKGADLRAFAHISELHATQSKIDRRDEFWQSDIVKQRLVRLEGFLHDTTHLLYRSHKGEKINIKLAIPFREHIPSQETVTFYLGFSWIGPVAYDVMQKSRDSRHDTMPRCFHQAYPNILSSDKSKKPLLTYAQSQKIDRLQKECQELSMQWTKSKTEGGGNTRMANSIQQKLEKKQNDLRQGLQEGDDSS